MDHTVVCDRCGKDGIDGKDGCLFSPKTTQWMRTEGGEAVGMEVVAVEAEREAAGVERAGPEDLVREAVRAVGLGGRLRPHATWDGRV